MDFTINTYRELIYTLKQQGFLFRTFEDYIEESQGKTIVLRHDIDRKPENALILADIEREYLIKGTYYFRVVPESWDENIINKISEMGHEVGYHYEDVSKAYQKFRVQRSAFSISRYKEFEIERKIAEIAIEMFHQNLERFRKIVPVRTICMHGSPLSRWDNRILWKYYDYREFGIIGEPYFDIDFNKVLYLTDTGRRWDGESFSIRDKMFNKNCNKGYAVAVNGTLNAERGTQNHEPSQRFHSTYDIIKTAKNNLLPKKIMITIHPQRWTNDFLPWAKELAWQNMKNVIKFFFIGIKLNK